MTTYAFDAETSIEPDGPGRWRATISSSWNINDNPNGGYALTPLLRAMAAETRSVSGGSEPGGPQESADRQGLDGSYGHTDPVSLTTHYLRPALGNQDATITAEVIRTGRRTSTVRGEMVQGGKPRLSAIATFADLAAGSDESTVGGFPLEIPPPDLAPVSDCVDRPTLAQGVELAISSRVDVRVDPRYAGFGGGDEAVTAGWIRFTDGRAPDSLSLPLFADSFPPSIFALVGRIGWVPTVELTVHVRRRPVPGWIRARFETLEATGSLLIEDGTLWDENDRVVARSRQLAMPVI